MTNPLLTEIAESGLLAPFTVSLPTGGKFYVDNEIYGPDVDPNEIAVRPLSAIDETMLRDPLLILSGRAVTEAIRKSCPFFYDPGRLADIDVLVILIGIRLASGGPQMDVNHKCSHCDHENVLGVDLQEHLRRFVPITTDELPLFEITLPVVGQKVGLKPPSYADAAQFAMMTVKHLSAASAITGEVDKMLNDDFVNQYQEQFQNTLKTGRDSVMSSVQYVETKTGNRVNDRPQIADWIDQIPERDIQAIRDGVGKINDAFAERSRHRYVCSGCSKDVDVAIEIDPQKLFTQAEDSPVKKEVLRAIQDHNKEREEIFKSIAEIALSYEGGLDYHKAKTMSRNELEMLWKIYKRQQEREKKAMQSA